MKFSITFALSFALLLSAGITEANVSLVNVTPSNPIDWMVPGGYTIGYIGDTGNGVLTVDNGSDIYSLIGYLGYGAGMTGSASISGAGSTWDSQTLHIGWLGSGDLLVNGGGSVTSENIYIGGHGANTSGILTVSGAGSTLTNNGYLGVGMNATGTLNILDGGVVNAYEARAASSDVADTDGIMHFENGTLNTHRLYAGASQLTGYGTINTNGLIADGIDLIFDADHGLQQTFNLNNQGQNIVLNLDYDNTFPTNLGAGFNGNGTLTIADGVVIDSFYGQIAAWSGSVGKATIMGQGSTWNVKTGLDVGDYGTGELEIKDGGLLCMQSTNAGMVRIDKDKDADSFINMSTGGMFALHRDADDSLDGFLDLLSSFGTEGIRWWDDSIADWAPITTATRGIDYMLEYQTEGDLAGYTVLTVGIVPVWDTTVPEPGTLVLICSALFGLGLMTATRKRTRN